MIPNIVIIRRPLEGECHKTGLGRYADNCQECIENHDVIESDFNLKSGLINFITNGLFRPFFKMKNADGENTVFHATDELCGFAFPFLKGKKVLTVHHIIKKEECSHLYYLIWIKIFSKAISNADRIIAISDLTLHELTSLNIETEKIIRIDNRINPAFRKIKCDKKDMICCVGELTARKNMQMVIDAFKEMISKPSMDSYSLSICGKGSEENTLKSYVNDLGLSKKVIFLKDLSTDEVVKLYNESKFVFNTSLHEGLGLLTIEAQRCGTPVLHLEYADIPSNVTKMSIPCHSAEDMGNRAFLLLNNKKEYEQICSESKKYADMFGDGYCEKYRKTLFDF